MKSTGQTITLGLGAALVIASLWRAGRLQQIWLILANQQGENTTDLLPALKNVGADLLFLIIVVWIAGLSDDASKVTGALLVALWLLFLFHQPTEGASGQVHKTLLPITNFRGV